jgi:hypothetical protein
MRPGGCVQALDSAIHDFGQAFTEFSFVGDLAIGQSFAD